MLNLNVAITIPTWDRRLFTVTPVQQTYNGRILKMMVTMNKIEIEEFVTSTYWNYLNFQCFVYAKALLIKVDYKTRKVVKVCKLLPFSNFTNSKYFFLTLPNS